MFANIIEGPVGEIFGVTTVHNYKREQGEQSRGSHSAHCSSEVQKLMQDSVGAHDVTEGWGLFMSPLEGMQGQCPFGRD